MIGVPKIKDCVDLVYHTHPKQDVTLVQPEPTVVR